MKISVENKIYHIDDDVLISYLKNAVFKSLDPTKLQNKFPIDLSKKSIFMTLVRQLLAFTMPVIDFCYDSMNITKPKKIKHEDIIKYWIECFLILSHHVTSMSNINLLTSINDNEDNNLIEIINANIVFDSSTNELSTLRANSSGNMLPV